MDIHIVSYSFFYVMLNLLQYLIFSEYQHITNKTLKQVQGDVHLMIHNGHSKEKILVQ